MLRLKLKGLYTYAGGFYAYSLFALIFWETRRSDFVVSMFHHIATIILIVLSYIFRYFMQCTNAAQFLFSTFAVKS